MGGLGRIIGGALAGLGDGLEQQTKLNYETDRDRLANEREIALTKLRGTIQADNTREQYDYMDRNAGRDDARGFAYGSQQAEQKQGFEQQNIILKGKIDLSNDKTVEGLKHTYNLSEQAADDARELQNQLTLAGVTVDHWEVTTGGKMVAFNKKGDALQQETGPGHFVPSRTSVSDKADDDGGTIADAIAARNGGSTHYADQSANPGSYDPSSTKPIGQKPVKQSILSQLSRMPPPPGGRVGATMTGPQGMKARWTGKQWELIGETVPRG